MFEFETPILVGLWDCTKDRDLDYIADQSGHGRDVPLVLIDYTVGDVWDTAGIIRFGQGDRAIVSTLSSNWLAIDDVTDRIVVFNVWCTNNNADTVDSDCGQGWDIGVQTADENGYSGFIAAFGAGVAFPRCQVTGGSSRPPREDMFGDGEDIPPVTWTAVYRGDSSQVFYYDMANTSAREFRQYAADKDLADNVKQQRKDIIYTTHLPAQKHQFSLFSSNEGWTPPVLPQETHYSHAALWLADKTPLNVDHWCRWIADHPGEIPVWGVP